MKISSREIKQEFKPFSLIIDIENEKDAAKIHAIFDYIDIVETLDLECKSEEIRETILKYYGEMKNTPFYKKTWCHLRTALGR